MSDNDKQLKIIAKFFGLSESELMIYKKVVEKKRAIVTELQKELNMSKRTIQLYLKNLYEKGLLIRKIPEKGRRIYEYYAKDPKKLLIQIFLELKKILEE